MIVHPTAPSPAAVSHSFTLNDLRVHRSIAEEPSSISALTISGLVLAAVLAFGAFIWLDPLHLFTPTEARPPAPAFVPSEPAGPVETQGITAPLAPVPETKSVEAPIAPASMIQAPHVPPPVVRPRAASIKSESRGNPIDKANATVLQASPKEQTALPVLPAKPDEKTDAPMVLKLGDETKNVSKPATTDDQASVTE
jgi:hypothetical protein